MKIKYNMAVVIIMIATAFSACGKKNAEMIPITKVDSSGGGDEMPSHSANGLDGLNQAVENQANVSSQNQFDSEPEYVSNNSSTNQAENTSNSNSIIQAGDASISNMVEYSSNSENNTKSEIYVYICGAVLYPNVYAVPANARIVDVVNMAGGLTEEAGKEYINLASPVYDGQKILIPTYEDISSGKYNPEEYANNINDSGTNSAANNSMQASQNTVLNSNQNTSNTISSNNNSSDSSKININTANETELMTIPGIGESKAEKIINYRQENGGFTQIEDIMFIPGIKEGLFNKIKDYIRVN